MAMNINPFPDSAQKDWLRRHHVVNILPLLKDNLGRGVNYFGFPSADMLDIRRWHRFIDKIVAIESNRDVATSMLRVASSLGVRSRLILLEKDLDYISRLIVEDDEVGSNSLSAYEITKLKEAKSIPYDIINLDFCSGFVFPKNNATSTNTDSIKNLIRYQSKYKLPFVLLLTFAMRDGGAVEYDRFIEASINSIAPFGFDSKALSRFYLAKTSKGVPPQLRRLRFCVPLWIHREAYQSYQVSSMGNWYYKTFYHTALWFSPRADKSVLGLPSWPPVGEIDEILRSGLYRIDPVKDSDDVAIEEVATPALERL